MGTAQAYSRNLWLMKPVQLAGYKLDRSTSDQLFKHLEKLGVETRDYQQNPDLIAYLEELALGRPKPRTSEAMQRLAPALQSLCADLIREHPALLKIYDLALGSGKTWFGFFERLWLSLPLSGQQALSSEPRAYAERERLFTTLPDREPCLHTLIWMDRTPSLWQISWVEENRGSWVCVYTPVGDNPEKLAIIASRGTAARLLAAGRVQSLSNNLLYELGAKAAQAAWPSLSRHMDELGIEVVELGGKSFGGNMTQHLGCLLAKTGRHVRSMITFQSPGICEAAHRAIQAIREVDERPLEVIDYPYATMKGRISDRTPHAGGWHLGHTLSDMRGVVARQIYISFDPEAEVPKQLHPLLEAPASLVGMVSSHVLRLGLVPHQIHLKERAFKPIEKNASIKHLEKIRRLVYLVLIVVTFGYFAKLDAKQPMASFISKIPDRLSAMNR